MLPRDDLATAIGWRDLAGEIGRKVCHGSAHEPNPEVAWLASGWDDLKRVFDALDFAAPQFFANSARLRGPDLGRALDFGAGAGRVAVHMAPFCDDLWCVDSSADLLEAIPDIANIERRVVREPAKVPQFGHFDTIVSLHVLYSMTPAGVTETVRQLGRALKPGGRMALDIPWHVNIPNDAHHEDPDPKGLPGGWWVHSSLSILEGADLGGVTVSRCPPSIDPPRWAALATPSLWSFRKAVA